MSAVIQEIRSLGGPAGIAYLLFGSIAGLAIYGTVRLLLDFAGWLW